MKSMNEFFAADSSYNEDAGSGDSSNGRIDKWPEDSLGEICWWYSQQKFWAATTDTTAKTATSKLEYTFRSKQGIRSRESH